MLNPGDRIADRFVVEALVGQGGLAEVYRVRHVDLGTTYALKLLVWKKDSLAKRMLQEGRIQAQLQHPNVVSVSDVVRHEGQLGLLMEYVEHETLESYLARNGPFELDAALELFTAILSAVAAAHGMGVLHRDIKPANVMLAVTGAGLVPKVTDFGIAKVLSDEVEGGSTAAGTAMGTPGYLAPEQVLDASTVDERTDIFALCAVLYEMLTGHRAFEDAEGNVTLRATLEGKVVPITDHLPDCPPHIAQIITICLDADRDGRITTVQELAERLLEGRDDLKALFEEPSRLRSLDLQVQLGHVVKPTLAPGSQDGETPADVVGHTLAPIDSMIVDPDKMSTEPEDAPPSTIRPTTSRGGVAWVGSALLVAVLVGAAVLVMDTGEEASQESASNRDAAVVDPPPAPSGGEPGTAEPVEAAPVAQADDGTAAQAEEPTGGQTGDGAEAPDPTPTAPKTAPDEPASGPPEAMAEQADGDDNAEEAAEATEDEASTEGGEATADGSTQGGETSGGEEQGDAVADASMAVTPDDEPSEPAPEAAPKPAWPNPNGLWSGKSQGKIPVNLELEINGDKVGGIFEIASPVSRRRITISGSYDVADRKLSFQGDGLQFTGQLGDGRIDGRYTQNGKKYFDWYVTR